MRVGQTLSCVSVPYTKGQANLCRIIWAGNETPNLSAAYNFECHLIARLHAVERAGLCVGLDVYPAPSKARFGD